MAMAKHALEVATQVRTELHDGQAGLSQMNSKQVTLEANLEATFQIVETMSRQSSCFTLGEDKREVHSGRVLEASKASWHNFRGIVDGFEGSRGKIGFEGTYDAASRPNSDQIG